VLREADRELWARAAGSVPGGWGEAGRHLASLSAPGCRQDKGVSGGGKCGGLWAELRDV